MRKAFFLDRDGTINVDTYYLIQPEDMKFIPGSPEAIAKLNHAGFLVIVVTNQSGIAKGYFTMEQVHHLHDYMQKELSEYGAKIDDFYICPHDPKYGEYCSCRKGKPGLLLQAAKDFGIDLTQSIMIGDKKSDIEAGLSAGCYESYLVETGYGKENLDFAIENNIPTGVDLSSIVEEILNKSYGEVCRMVRQQIANLSV